jgi:hypothetical protein
MMVSAAAILTVDYYITKTKRMRPYDRMHPLRYFEHTPERLLFVEQNLHHFYGSLGNRRAGTEDGGSANDGLPRPA